MIFSEQERSIFSYPSPDGQGFLYEDPLRLRRELLLVTNGQINDWLASIKKAEELDSLPEPARIAEYINQYELEGKLAEAMRWALGGMVSDGNGGQQRFYLPRVDLQKGTGFTDAWVLEVLHEFVKFMAKKKTSAETSVTSSQPTEQVQDQ